MPFSDPPSSAPGSPPQPAAPPTRQEIERKLSVHSISTSDSPHPPKRMQRKGSLPSSPTNQASFFPASTSASSQGGFLPSPFPSSPPQIQRTLSAHSPFSQPSSLPPAPSLTLEPLSLVSPPSVAPPSLGPAAPSSALPTSTSQNLAAISETQGMRTFSDSENELEYEGEDEEGATDEEEGEGAEDGEMRRKVEGERVLKSGFLDKKGEKRKNWKKRWFVLRTEKLSYYKDDREYKLLRLIDLHDIHSVALVQLKKYTSALCIVTQTRTYYVKARTTNDAESWVEAIKLARKELKEADEAKTRSPQQGGPSTSSGGAPAPGMTRRMTGSVSGQGGQAGPSSTQSVSPSISASSAGGVGLFTPTSPFLLSTPTSAPNSPPSPLRINPNQPEWTSSPTTVTSPTTIMGSSPVDARPPSSPTRGGMVSSSDDEDYEERSNRDPEGPSVVSTDPNKVILSGYLMKMGKRKNWRKRWFVLTSGSLVYCSSHMDTKPHRIIPLSRILDALEYEPASKENSNASPDPSSSTGTPAKSMSASSSMGVSLGGDKSSSKHVDHSLKIVTAKKAFILCAPSEEEEIKWLSAIQALVARRTGGSPPRAAPTAVMPPARSQPAVVTSPAASSPPIPTILEQPPSPPAVPPATIPGSIHAPRAPSPSRQPTQQTHSHHMPSIEAQISEKFPRSGSESEASAGTGPGSAGRGAMRRERSDTTAGKEAVESVRRRYHPDEEQ